MSAVVADTHIAIWYLASPDKLSPNALAPLDEADATGSPIYVASISVVEVTHLIEKGRLPEVVSERLISELSHPDSGPGGGTYYWRVRSSNSYGTGAWSAKQEFTVPTPSPLEFKLYLPVILKN